MQRRSDVFTGFECQVVSRVNANGDTVYDVIEPNGLKRSIVFGTIPRWKSFEWPTLWGVVEDPERDIQIQSPG